MTRISDDRFIRTLDNRSIDLEDPEVRDALAAAGIDEKEMDALDVSDGRDDGFFIGNHANLRALYEQIDSHEKGRTNLRSPEEAAAFTALRSAAVGPETITSAQGRAIVAAAREVALGAIDPKTGKDGFAFANAVRCQNPAVPAGYAGTDTWKCNVFVGEALFRAGLPPAINDAAHYVSANGLASHRASLHRVTDRDDIRPGDLLNIRRGDDLGHVEIITAVERDRAGHVTGLTSMGAREAGVTEDTSKGEALLKNFSSTGDETYLVLRARAPFAPRTLTPADLAPIKG